MSFGEKLTMRRLVLILVLFYGLVSMIDGKSLSPGSKDKKHSSSDPFFNKPEPKEEEDTAGTLQSDMKLTDEQLAAILAGIDDLKNGRSKRKATTLTQYHWPEGRVPYKISAASALDTFAIESAMHHWEEHTCIRFHERTQEKDYIHFIKGDGCWSSVGRIGGQQDVSIGLGCDELGTVAHEIGHALAFHHEQTRPDRDDFVTVHYGNIDPSHYVNFAKYHWLDISTKDIPYDYASVMHYGPYYFSNNKEATMTTDSPLDQIQMGNREGLSFADIKLANAVYKCGEFGAACDGVSLTCMNKGYLGPDCECICPSGYSGIRCEIEDAENGCIKEVTDETGVIQSPNYPGYYGNYDKCLWYIKGPEGATITVTFESFALEVDALCDYDYLQIRTEAPFITGGLKYCGISSPGTVSSSGNAMVVEFVADFLVTARGFKANWVINMPPEPSTTTLPPPPPPPSTTAAAKPPVCPEYKGCRTGRIPITDSCALIRFGPYNNMQSCSWLIEVPKGSFIKFKVDKLDIQENSKCKFDYLQVLIDPKIKVNPILCGKSIPQGPIISSGNTMKLVFKSNRKGKGNGFVAHYTTLTP